MYTLPMFALLSGLHNFVANLSPRPKPTTAQIAGVGLGLGPRLLCGLHDCVHNTVASDVWPVPMWAGPCSLHV